MLTVLAAAADGARRPRDRTGSDAVAVAAAAAAAHRAARHPGPAAGAGPGRGGRRRRARPRRRPRRARRAGHGPGPDDAPAPWPTPHRSRGGARAASGGHARADVHDRPRRPARLRGHVPARRRPTTARAAALRAALDRLGDSVAVVGDGAPDGGGTWNVHVHCTDIGAAIEAGVAAGRPHGIRVVPAGRPRARDGVPPAPGPCSRWCCGPDVGRAGRARPARTCWCATVPAAGRRRDRRRRGAARRGGGRHRRAARRAAAQRRRAHRRGRAGGGRPRARAGQEVVVVPTRVAGAGLAALAVHDPAAARGRRRRRDGRGGRRDPVGCAEVADAEALTWAGPCRPGDVLGLVDGEVVLIAPDLSVGALWLASRMLPRGASWSPCCSATVSRTRSPTGWRRQLRRDASGGGRRRAPGGAAGPSAAAGGGMTRVGDDRERAAASTSTRPLVGPVGQEDGGRAGREARPAHRRRPGVPLPAPLRRARASTPTSPALELGEQVTVLAEVEKVTMRDMRQRRGKLMEVVLTDGHGRRLDCHLLQPVQAARRSMVPGPAGAVRRQGLRVPRQAAAQPPGVRAARGERGRPPVPVDLPGDAGVRPWEIAPLRAAGAGAARRPRRTRCRPTLRARRACPSSASALRHIHRPETEARPVRREEPAEVGRGVRRAAHPGAAQAAGRQRPARPRPPRAGRPARRLRRPAAVHADRRPAGGRRGDRRRPGVRGTRCTGCCRARSARARRWCALRAMLQVVDAGGQAALLAPTEVLAAQHAPLASATLLGPLGRAGELGGGRARHPGRRCSPARWARRPAGGRCSRSPSGAAGIVVGTHALLYEGVEFADLGPGRGRRAAPLRRRAARRAARPRPSSRRTCW